MTQPFCVAVHSIVSVILNLALASHVKNLFLRSKNYQKFFDT